MSICGAMLAQDRSHLRRRATLAQLPRVVFAHRKGDRDVGAGATVQGAPNQARATSPMKSRPTDFVGAG
jgi:hypothetical protein